MHMAKEKMNRSAAIGIFVILIIAVGAFIYVADTTLTKTTNGKTVTTPISSGTGSTGTVWASLYIQNQDGSNYWVNAPSSFNVASIYGSASGSGSDFNEITSETNTIYMNIVPTGTVISWTFSCQETVALETTSGTIIGYGTQTGFSTTPQSFTVNANGETAPSGQSIQVTQTSSITEQNLQSWLSNPTGTYYFTVTLSNINLQLTTSSGTQTLTAPAPTQANVLSWLIKIA
jgi:hypothetical protein